MMSGSIDFLPAPAAGAAAGAAGGWIETGGGGGGAIGDSMRVNSLGPLLPNTDAPIGGGVAGVPHDRGGAASGGGVSDAIGGSPFPSRGGVGSGGFGALSGGAPSEDMPNDGAPSVGAPNAGAASGGSPIDGAPNDGAAGGAASARGASSIGRGTSGAKNEGGAARGDGGCTPPLGDSRWNSWVNSPGCDGAGACGAGDGDDGRKSSGGGAGGIDGADAAGDDASGGGANGGGAGKSLGACGESPNDPKIAVKLDPESAAGGGSGFGGGAACGGFTASMITVGIASSLRVGVTPSAIGGSVVGATVDSSTLPKIRVNSPGVLFGASGFGAGTTAGASTGAGAGADAGADAGGLTESSQVAKSLKELMNSVTATGVPSTSAISINFPRLPDGSAFSRATVAARSPAFSASR